MRSAGALDVQQVQCQRLLLASLRALRLLCPQVLVRWACDAIGASACC